MQQIVLYGFNMKGESLGTRLVEALKAAGMSQAELARRLGIKQQSVNYLCRPEATKSGHTTQIAAILGVSADWLANGTGPRDRASGTSFALPIVANVLKDSVEMAKSLAIIDPACGTGSFLLAAADILKDMPERDRQALAQTVEREVLRRGAVAQGDIFAAAAKARGVDLIFTNPPYSISASATRIAHEGKGRPGFDRWLQRYWLNQAQEIVEREAPKAKALIESNGLIYVMEKGQRRSIAKVVPLVGRVAGGPWLEAERPYPLDFGDDAFLSIKARSPDAFALEVVGNSMSEVYEDRDRVVVEPRQKYESGDDVVVARQDRNDPDEAVTLKRVKDMKFGRGGRIEQLVLSSRPAAGSDTKAERIELAGDRFRIIGKVVDSKKPLAA